MGPLLLEVGRGPAMQAMVLYEEVCTWQAPPPARVTSTVSLWPDDKEGKPLPLMVTIVPPEASKQHSFGRSGCSKLARATRSKTHNRWNASEP